jgi:hypothetical protein
MIKGRVENFFESLFAFDVIALPQNLKLFQETPDLQGLFAR